MLLVLCLASGSCLAGGVAEVVSPLAALSKETVLHSEPGQPGQWVEVRQEQPFNEKEFKIGRMPQLERFVACYRGQSSCWMEARAGRSLAEVPAETQFLLARLANGDYLGLMAMLDGGFRSSLSGGPDGCLQVLAESGDSQVRTNRVTALYVEQGRDPYALIQSAALRVRLRVQPAALNTPRQTPAFVRDLGWCSWNAFYNKVSHDTLLQALQQFEQGGVAPGFVVVDEGWQSAADRMLTGYEANPKQFPAGIGSTVRALKQTGHVSRVLVWHTFNGYWRGADPKALPALDTAMVTPSLPNRLTGEAAAGTNPGAVRRFYPPIYRQPVAEPNLGKLFGAYHAFLRDQGVDGVKIDAMTWVETLGEGRGGRVRAMRELVEATARSEREFFSRNIIWCSSCSSDCILQAPRSAVMRTSCDYFPDKPETHGRHVINNALNSLWMGEFVLPDWDMFQTHQAAGAFHAAARAICGGPVYISDDPARTDFALLRQLVFSDRTVPLCLGPARPTADSLFVDSTQTNRLFKIFNLNPVGGGVVGVFNCAYDPATNKPVSGQVCGDDVVGLGGREFAVFRHQEGSLRRVSRSECLPVALRPLEWETFTFAPIHNSFAAIGLADKLNSGGCVSAVRYPQPQRIEVDLRDGGEFIAWCEQAPRSVACNGQSLPFQFDRASGALRVSVPRGRPVTLICLQP